MKDLTKIKTPFGLLGKKTRNALRAHGGPYEVFQGGKWRVCIGKPLWIEHLAYRVGDYFEVRVHHTPEQAAAMQAAFDAKKAVMHDSAIEAGAAVHVASELAQRLYALSPEWRKIFGDVLARSKVAAAAHPHPIFAAVKEWQEARFEAKASALSLDTRRYARAMASLAAIKVPS